MHIHIAKRQPHPAAAHSSSNHHASASGPLVCASPSVLSTSASAQAVQWWSWLGCNILLLALFIEWLLPFYTSQQYRMTIPISTWLLAIGTALMAGLSCRSRWSKGGIIVIAAWLLCAWTFGEGGTWRDKLSSLPSTLVQTVQSWISDVEKVITVSLQGGTYHFSEYGEGMLMLLCLMLLSVLVQSLMASYYTVYLFSAVTFVYLLLMEKVLGVHTGDGLIRAFIVTLILVSWLQMQRYRENVGQAAPAWPARWWVATMAMTAGLVIGYTIWSFSFGGSQPKIWPALETWVQKQFEEIEGTSSSYESKLGNGTLFSIFGQTGYGTDDTRLGMPIAMNKEILFRAQNPHPTYWRAESKRIYTGQGWMADKAAPQSDGIFEEVIDPSGALRVEDNSMSEAQKAVWSAPFKQRLSFEQHPANLPILHGGQLVRLNEWNSDSSKRNASKLNSRNGKLLYSPALERYRVQWDGAEAGRQELNRKWEPQRERERAVAYELEVSRFIGTPAQLNRLAEQDDPEEVKRLYTELPKDLPQRVTDLTNKLVAGAATRYERIERVQRFLLENYSYTTDSTSVPSGTKDFVDDFLFEQRQGYCVHFSTAMAVMLRTQGIPTRWVKGFAPGESESDQSYTVRNSDAHAWVEVYIPEAGWVPFDPTPARGIVSEGEQQAVVMIPARADVIQGDDASYALHRQPNFRALGGAAVLGDDTSFASWIDRLVHDVEAILQSIGQGGAWLLSQLLEGWTQLLHEATAWRDGTLWELGRNALITFWQADNWIRLYSEFPITMSAIGAFLVLCIVLIIVYLVRHTALKYPEWKLRSLLRLQQQSYQSSRALRIGELACSMIERRLGRRMPGMTWEDYVNDVNSNSERSIKLSSMDQDMLERFIACSNSMLYAEAGERKRHADAFRQVCLELVRWRNGKAVGRVDGPLGGQAAGS